MGSVAGSPGCMLTAAQRSWPQLSWCGEAAHHPLGTLAPSSKSLGLRVVGRPNPGLDCLLRSRIKKAFQWCHV